MNRLGRFMSAVVTIAFMVSLWALVHYNKPAPPEAPVRVVIDDQLPQVMDPFFCEEGVLFVNTSLLSEMGFAVEVDEASSCIALDVLDGDVAYEDKAVTKMVEERAGKVLFPAKQLNTGWFVELERLDQWLGIQSGLSDDGKCLLLDTPGERVQGRVSDGDVALYQKPNGAGALLKTMREGEKVRLFSELGRNYKARTADGKIGYVASKSIIAYGEKETGGPFTSVREGQSRYGPINVTFEYVSSYAVNPKLSEEKRIPGLDVLCPTWFSLNESGFVTNDASVRYVRDAHALGYRVWGVMRNEFEPERTHKMLADRELRAGAIADIAFYAAFYELDGINVDYENVYKNDQALFSAFLDELDAVLTRQGVTLSIDAAVPWGSEQWSLFLDRWTAARTADYIVLMAYDEHHANSEESGSVSSIGWTRAAVEKSLSMIPPEKLILGIPLYTRVWSEKTDESGAVSVESISIGMKDQDALLKGTNPDYTYDEDAGQLLASFREDGVLKKIWIENEDSVKARLEIAKEFKLAGVGSWRRGLESEAFWSWVNGILKGQ